MEFKKRLAELRKKKNLYQTDIAKKIGVPRATYGAYEQGNRQPDFDVLERIADLYGVTTDYLLGRTDNPGTNDDDIDKTFYMSKIANEFPDIDLMSKDQQKT